MKGLTYFRLRSQYEGDITKNCALDGYEVDSNFNTLEGRDVKSITVENGNIIITLLNGDIVKANDAINQNVVTNIEFDKVNGILKINKNGMVETIGGFSTELNSGDVIAAATDNTLKGDGTTFKPLGISDMAKAGQYMPVDSIVDITEGFKLPSKHNLVPGDRFITKENVSNYGFLYDYNALRKIACDLRDCNSEWRIPTKEDWDDMLNAVEPCDNDKDHNSAINNKYLGKWAGKLLKSVDLWKMCSCEDNCNDPCDFQSTCINYDTPNDCLGHEHCHCGKNIECGPKFCGEYGHCHHRPIHDNRGLDKYGFRVTPAGYADDGENFVYFGERSSFWTASNSKCTSAYVKRFEFNTSKVHQDIIASQYHLSLRLVKDFKGNNYNEREDILGNSYSTVLMPSAKNGQAIWTSVNFANGNKCYNPVMPNDGQNLSYQKLYFINEWDGDKWVRNSISEGDSVVVKHSPDCKQNVEYRLVNGELVNVMTAVYSEVMGEVGRKLNELNNKIENNASQLNATDEHLSEVETRLNEFSEQTNAAIENLGNSLDSESEARKTEDEKLANAIESERIAREDVEAQLWTGINNETAAREDVDNQQWTAINNETAAREDVEAQIWNAVNNEASAREDVDNQQWTAIQNETEARTSVDDQQWEAIANETAAREDVEAQIWNAVNNEIERSQAKEAEIEGKLLSEEGTEFNEETGVLTLKSNDGTNDIEVQIKANFGTF